MGIFSKKRKKTDSATAFEKAFVNEKAKLNPVVKAGSIVLYAIIALAILTCILMVALDKTGVVPSPLMQKDKVTDNAQSVDVESLPEELQQLYKENFETADFVSSYLKEKDKERTVSLKKYRTSKQMPLFIQWDKQWGYLQYGESLVGVNGDGPMCLAMAGYHFTKDEKFSPDKVISFSLENGYYKKGKGTLASLMTEGASALGLKSIAIKVTEKNITSALDEGKAVVCLVNKGSLSSSAHYIVVRGYEDGKLFINDPTSIVNSEKGWSAGEIIPEIKNAYVLSV